jgi:hypothetical protein
MRPDDPIMALKRAFEINSITESDSILPKLQTQSGDTHDASHATAYRVRHQDRRLGSRGEWVTDMHIITEGTSKNGIVSFRYLLKFLALPHESSVIECDDRPRSPCP